MSYFLRNSSEAALCRPHVENRIAALSFQTVAELWHGALKKQWGEEKRHALDNLIRRFVVLIADEATARAWAELKVVAEEAGRPKSVEDLWIAATARRHSLPLLTNDGDYFTGLDITAVKPDDAPIEGPAARYP